MSRVKKIAGKLFGGLFLATSIAMPVQIVYFSTPRIISGREGMDLRRYVTWPFSKETIIAEVSRGDYNAEPLIGRYRFTPFNQTVTSFRLYSSDKSLVIANTDDWGIDGEQDTLHIQVITGEWSRSDRRLLFEREWTRERIGGKLVLFSDVYQGSKTEKEVVKLSPNLGEFSDSEGNIDPERFSIAVRQEAYQMTEADSDPRFVIKKAEEDGK